MTESDAKPVVLQSRWGLAPVVIDDYGSRQRGTSPSEDDDEDEPTGRVLWDCAQILWDLVADPDPCNKYAVRGKRVIELGGGTGALSVGLARAGAASVTCTDLPCHLARIESTVRANSLERGLGREASGRHAGDGGGCGGFGGDSGAGEVPVARMPDVVVRGLRWGDEEDLARVRVPPKLEEDVCHSGGDLNSADLWVAGGGASGVGGDEGGGGGEPEASPEGDSSAFDVVVLSEVLYWPALDLLQEDTREPLRRTLLGLSKAGTRVILIYKERWPEREMEFLRSCEGGFEVRGIPADLLALPALTNEEPDSSAVRAVEMVRLPPTGLP